MLTIINNTR